MNCKILEINTGPGMEPHNKDDKQMRENLMKSMLSLLEKRDSVDEFRKIFEKRF